MPLTSGNVTIKLSAGDYSTWAAFWDDIGDMDGNITCTVDASAYTEGVAPVHVGESLNGYTLHILPTSFPTTTDASTGARFTCNYADEILRIELQGVGTVIIEGMVFLAGTSAPVDAIVLRGIATGFDFTFRRNIIEGCAISFKHEDSTLSDTKVYNNIIFNDTGFAAFSFVVDLPSAIIANNTSHSNNINYHFGREELDSTNNLAYNASGNCFNQITLLTSGFNNADNDGTGANGNWGGIGTNNLINISDPFNALGSDDVTITAEGVIGSAGQDLSGDFTDDFFGVTRSNWTIGACEWISAQDITEPALALIEVEIDVTAIRSRIEVVSALIEMEAEVTASWQATNAVSALIGMGASAPSKIISVLSALIEVEMDITASKGKQSAVSALIEMEMDVTEAKDIIRAVSAPVEVEMSIAAAWALVREVSALIEVEIAITGTEGKWGETSVVSALIRVRASAPSAIVSPASALIEVGMKVVAVGVGKWLLIPDYLRWKGVWSAAYGYDRDDAVIYKSGGLIHAFVSKTDHNTGNIPRSTYQHWTRLVQEQWEK